MTPATPTVRVAQAQDSLSLVWDDGLAEDRPALWLRDNCRCPACRHPDNDQRLFDIADLPTEVRIAGARVADGAVLLDFAPDGHKGRIPVAWLRRIDGDEPEPQLWGAEMAKRLPRADYNAVRRDPAALRRVLEAVRVYGFAVLVGVPSRPGQVIEVAELFGFVRETNYGRLFDVRAVANPSNLAYSDLGLGVHTDNPYRDPVPGLQLLHCLESDVDGGDTLLVDGFRAAAVLREEAPTAFALLTQHAVPFRYRDDETDLRARVRLIETDDRGRVVAVHYNNRSIGTIDLPADVLGDFYDAYRRFAAILRRPNLTLRFKLDPGALLLMDNRRTLHGRTAYTGTGSRHLQGCYADRDGLESTLRRMRGAA
jgi:gamma-butyrobetaine dioxygenase